MTVEVNVVRVRTEARTAILQIAGSQAALFDITGNPGPSGPAGPSGPPGPAGPAGTATSTGHVANVAQPATVWTITHNLGFDPAGIAVISSDGFLLDDYGVQYLSPGVSLRLSFDIGVSGVAYLS